MCCIACACSIVLEMKHHCNGTVWQAGAAEKGVPLYKHLADLAGNKQLVGSAPLLVGCRSVGGFAHVTWGRLNCRACTMAQDWARFGQPRSVQTFLRSGEWCGSCQGPQTFTLQVYGAARRNDTHTSVLDAILTVTAAVQAKQAAPNP